MARSNDPHRHPARGQRSSYLFAPPLLRGPEHLEGAPILDELPSPLGVLLWGTYRNLVQWMAGSERAPHPTHSWAFAAPSEISGAVAILSGISTHQGRVPDEEASLACLCIATWAKDQQYRSTALAYTQAAALLRPSDPVLAYRVGRMARDASQYPRAESWLRAAVKLSRGSDWKTYALAYIALANLYLDVGNFPAARSLAHRVLRTARRHSLPALAGMAYHALFIMAAQSGAAKEAHDLALSAFTHYGQDHPRIPALAHDLASFWSDWGRFERSLPVFRAIARWFPAPDDLVVVTANRARAAAALGLEEEYKTAFAETLNTLPQCGSAPRKADAFLTLARSAASMKEFALAVDYGTRAHRMSLEHGLHQLQMEAEAALDAIKAERHVSTGPSEPPGARETGNQLAGALALSLAAEGPTSTRLPARSRGLTC